MPTRHNVKSLDAILRRSDTLDEAIISLLDPEKYETYDASERISASFLACTVSLEHARGLRALLCEGLPTPAISLMRLQYEALTRSVWLLYAAPDVVVEKLHTALTPAAEKAASRLPMLSEMLGAIEGKAPPAATQMLNEFKDVSLKALNSFVHGGIHPLRRQTEGYPLPLLIQVIRNSNGLLTMSGMMLAILSGNPTKRFRISFPTFTRRNCSRMAAGMSEDFLLTAYHLRWLLRAMVRPGLSAVFLRSLWLALLGAISGEKLRPVVHHAPALAFKGCSANSPGSTTYQFF